MNTNRLNEGLLSIADAAKFTDTSEDTVRRRIARGELKAYRFGKSIRIKPSDLERSLKPVTTFRPAGAA